MICSRCIYDDRIPHISFDGEGVCNYCKQHDQLNLEYPTGEEGWRRLQLLTDEIKKKGQRKKYDVVVGVSGGTDSTYMLYVAKKLGLRPLAAHFDNTWNSKIAVENIHHALKKLDVDLFTYVVDSQEYNDILKSFFKSSTPDIETPADIGLAVTHYLAAQKYGIKYIFEGHSYRTEGIAPIGWFYMDAKYIQTVHRQFGSCPMKTFPNLWLTHWLKWTIIDGVKKIRPMYFIDYNKVEIRDFLSKNLDWQWYGGHHMENRSSYFMNNYYLPRKFGYDLRYTEFSAHVRSGYLSRDEALKKIREPKEFDQSILEEIKKRLGFLDTEFDAIMQAPPQSYRDYQTYKQLFEKWRWFFWAMYKLDLVPKSFYLKYTQKYHN